MSTSTEAQQWVKRLSSSNGLSTGWRLQILEKKARTSTASGEVKVTDSLPSHIRRFCNGLPWSLISDVVAELHAQAPYTDIIYNGVALEGKYVPTRTWWERDEKAIVDKGKLTAGTYTLYQDLIDTQYIDSCTFPSSQSCSEIVSAEYTWDSPSIPDVGLSDQGKMVSVQAVSRAEDGALNYCILTRVARTQSTPKTLTETTTFSKTYTQSWRNLYGEPPNSFKADSVNGTAVTMPSNTDRTVVTLTIEKNQDCTYDVTAKFVESLQVESQVVAKKRTLHAQQLSWTDREVSSPDASEWDLKIGESIRVEKTESGKYNVTKECLDSSISSDDIRLACQKTQFVHIHEKTYVTSKSTSFGDAVSASGGVVHSRSVTVNDDGTKDVSVKTQTELPVALSKKTISKTLKGTRIVTEDRNQTSDGMVNESSMELGEERSYTKTDGKLYDRSKTTFSTTSVGITSVESSATATQSTTTRTGNFATTAEIATAFGLSQSDIDSAFSTNGGDASFSLGPDENGTVKKFTISKTDVGTYDVSMSTTTVVGGGNGIGWSNTISTPYEYKYTYYFRNVSADRLGELTSGIDSITFDLDHTVVTAKKTGAGKRTEYSYDTNSSDVATKIGDTIAAWTSGMVDDKFTSDTYTSGFDNSAQLDGIEVNWHTSVSSTAYPPSSISLTLNQDLNDYGFYDGAIQLTAKWSLESCGQNGCMGEGVYYAFHVGNSILVSGRGYSSLKQLWDGHSQLFQALYNAVKGSSNANISALEFYQAYARGTSVSYDPLTTVWHASLIFDGIQFNMSTFFESAQASSPSS